MIFIVFSIVCNILVSVFLKKAKGFKLDIRQAIVWNYLVASLLTVVSFRPDLQHIQMEELPVKSYLTLALLLPSLFFVIGKSIAVTGIVRTDVAQRLSLLIPVFSAFVFFNEHLSTAKAGGISLGFIAILASIPWQSKHEHQKKSGWPYLAVVFVGMGLIDVLFKQIAQLKSVPYTSSLLLIYLSAFVFSLAALLLLLLNKKTRLTGKNLLGGIILGIANFGNILFYMKAHQSLPTSPSVVFSAMNIGVIVAGSIVGLWLFNEKLSWLNKAGILLALVSILIISNS